jgi:hypothetical protein
VKRVTAFLRAKKNRLALLVALYFAVQIGVPAYLKSRATDEASGDFSWDMFSYHVSCPQMSARAKLPDGQLKRLRLDRAFPDSAQLTRLMFPARLEAFADFVCAGLSEKHGGPVELHLRIECTYGRDKTPVALSDPERDYCRN